jgi:hypothetical protein
MDSTVRERPSARRRNRLPTVGAAVAGLTALLYFLIGYEYLSVVEGDDEPELVFIAAGLFYVLGVILLMSFDWRPLWVAGALLQGLTLYAYIDVADERTPAYEPWGIVIKVTQVVLLAVLVALALRPGPAAGVDRAIGAGRAG